MRRSANLASRAAVLFVVALAAPAAAQYDVPTLEWGYPVPICPDTNLYGSAEQAAFTPNGGDVILPLPPGGGYVMSGQIGAPIVGLTSQYGIGDVLPPPPGIPVDAWPMISTNQGNPECVQWFGDETFLNSDILLAVDEGTVVVQWMDANGQPVGRPQAYVIGPNLTRRPVRLFWTEGQYSGPRVRFGNNYEVRIWYNSQIPDPAADTNNLTYIAQEQISSVYPETIFIKNSELRACAGVSGRVLITYSRRPAGADPGVRELLAYEVVDVLEPMSATLSAHVAERLLPGRSDYDTEQLFCDVTRGGMDASGEQPEDVFVYKHTVGARTGWVWAVRPTDAPWEIEIFWKAKEQLDVIWPFEVDIYDVTWDLDSQLCALRGSRGGSSPGVYVPAEVVAEVMPYQAVPSLSSPDLYEQSGYSVASANGGVLHATTPGMFTVKYSGAEDVWFESIRAVDELSDLVYQGTIDWEIGEELEPFLSQGIADARYFEWPGFLRVPYSSGGAPRDDRGDRYHAGLYNYPTAYPVGGDVSAESQIFAVNEGDLGVWWWNASEMALTEGMPAAVYWPSLVCDYTNQWPGLTRQIVIASFQGSVSDTPVPDSSGSLESPTAEMMMSATLGIHPSHEQEWENQSYDEGFTFETWLLPDDVVGEHGIMNMHVGNFTNIAFTLENGLPKVIVTGLSYGSGDWIVSTQVCYATQGIAVSKWSHVAVSCADGAVQMYVNGVPAGLCDTMPDDLYPRVLGDVRLGLMEVWVLGGEIGKIVAAGFEGHIDETRMWWGVRSAEEILANYAGVPPVSERLMGRFDYDAALGAGLPLQTYADVTGRMIVTLGDGTLITPPSVPLFIKGRAYPSGSPVVYVQNSAMGTGFNPNEEHGLMVGGIAYALRSDLNENDTSEPYTLVEYTPDTESWQRAIDVYHVVPTNSVYPEFAQSMEAGKMLQPPPPLRSLLPDNCEGTHPDEADVPSLFRDRLRYYWAKQAGNDGGSLEVGMHFCYPMQLGFWFPSLAEQPAPLTEIPWLTGLDSKSGNWELEGEPVRVAFSILWPEHTPVLEICDTLTLPKNNLPAIRGQKSVGIVYEQSVTNGQGRSVVLIDPTRAGKAQLLEIPSKMRANYDPRTGNIFFSDLEPDLRERLFYVPTAATNERAQLKGLFVEYPTYHYLRLNLLTPDQVALAKDAERMVGIDETWEDAIDDLPTTRFEIEDEVTPFDSLALCTPGLGAGYVTVVFNNSTDIDMVDPGDPIDMAVIRIDTNLYAGRLDIIESSNPLDKYLTIRHTSDFAGEPQKWEFDWQYGSPDSAGMPPASNDWRVLINEEAGRYSTIFGSSGEFGLGDAWVRCRYRARDSNVAQIVGTEWSPWTSPVLCEGWIKRVLKAITPFDQRIRDFMNYALNTDLSMLQQAGQPYAGDVPLNMDALNEYGLIPIYQTLLSQARDLSIDSTLGTNATDKVICLALMLAAGRLNDLYMVLGNEAYADAANPTLTLGSDDPVFVAEATSIFAFQNLVPTLLDEELALLRGRDCSAPCLPDPETFPIHNRLPWNFSSDITHGQLAYVLNYGISDLKGDQDGTVDADDAAALYPQGHGDAWGHYLSAVKSYYLLFRHRNFTWFPQLEGIRVGQMETTMSALHEQKFAAAAAAKAEAGLAIIHRTHCLLYEEGTDEPWRVQRDTRTNRVWGVGEWGARANIGAYYDWVMANALLPESAITTNALINPLAVIDRTTVPELWRLCLAADDIQQAIDMADRGFNPLGLGPGAVPFDISPAEIDAGNTHFEQAYTKAQQALTVAHSVFERVQACTAAIRDQNEQRDFDTTVLEQEQAFDRRLIDVYGYPYQEDIGPGKLYPEGYIGPDTKHYFYINRYDFFGGIDPDMEFLQTTLVEPHINGTRPYAPGEIIAPPPPSDDPALTLETVLQFVSPELSTRYEELKQQYTELQGKMLTRNQVASLGIPEVTSLFNEAMSAYDEITAAAYAQVADVVAWFDGVISAPVDEIDAFFSQWVGPSETLNEDFTITGPVIAYTTNMIQFWVGPNGLPAKPDDYLSNRRAEGEIQVALSQYSQALREAAQAIKDSRAQYKKVLAADQRFRNTVGAQLTAYYNDVYALDQMNSLEQIVAAVSKAKALVEKVYADGMELYEAVEAAIPSIAGMSMDIGAAVRGPARAATAAVNMFTTVQRLANGDTITERKEDIELAKKIVELNSQSSAIHSGSGALAAEVLAEATEYLKMLESIDAILQNAETFRMQYVRAIAEGDMIQVEREQARRIWASDLSGERYRNMAYQVIRNDELARYEQTFAMAARYVYLAAKAYDYETGLLRQDGAVGEPGREFLSQIVRARALGRFGEDGTPLPGGSTGDPGLADIMARMSANWSVLDGRLSFNNPQTETGMFSLRRELFRIPESTSFDHIWQERLQEHLVDDVLSLTSFRSYCLPFTPTEEREPALVIPFTSTIDFRRNYFDLPLGPGDNAYDSTHFATKIRSVGVWFSNYQSTMLANQPRVYLIPIGQDIMRVPDGVGETLRSWNILDQALPIPYTLSDESWASSDWHVSSDILGGEFFARRRFPSLRAYHDDGFDVAQMSGNSRLIGRSVWNTQWLLIIPGGTLLADADSGLAQFINGRELSPGSGSYDGEGVRDIKLFFQTYSYSGN